MSICVPIKDLTPRQIQVVNDLRICIQSQQQQRRNPHRTREYIYPCIVNGEKITVPFYWGQSKLNLERPPRDRFEVRRWNFTGHLRKVQEEVFQECLSGLNRSGSIILSAYPGFGKTFLAIKIARRIKFKTLILVNRLVLQKQWTGAINKFSEATPAVLKPPGLKLTEKTVKRKKKEWDEADIGIVNPQLVGKFPSEWWSQVGCVVVDECHQIMSKGSHKALNFLTPRYVVALSATPYRPDGLNNLLQLYFGEKQVKRELWRPHTVCKVQSPLVPKSRINEHTGKLDWNSVLNSISSDTKRNQAIVRLCCILSQSKRRCLILTKRINQADCLSEMCAGQGITVCKMYGKHNVATQDSQVLIGTSSKIGVGVR